MSKLFKQALLGLVILGAAAFATAQLTPATRTQSALSDEARDASIVEVQSQIPDQSNRYGYLLARFDVDTDGGAQASYEIGSELPVGMMINEGYVQVVDGFEPAGTRVALSVQTSDDLLAATDFSALGVHRLAPSDLSFIVPVTPDGETTTTLGSPISIATTPKRVTVTVSAEDATEGTIFVYLRLAYMQPPE